MIFTKDHTKKMAQPVQEEAEFMVANPEGFFDGLDAHMGAAAGAKKRSTNFWGQELDPRDAKIMRMEKKAAKWNEKLSKAKADADEYRRLNPSSSDSEEDELQELM